MMDETIAEHLGLLAAKCGLDEGDNPFSEFSNRAMYDAWRKGFYKGCACHLNTAANVTSQPARLDVRVDRTMNKFRLIQDDDCHWYVIRADQSDEFYEWEQAQADCVEWSGHDFNENRVNGPQSVVFDDWKEV